MRIQSNFTRIIIWCMVSAFFTKAQAQNFWTPIQEENIRIQNLTREIIPNQAQLYRLDLNSLIEQLNQAPLRGESKVGVIMQFPNAAGRMEQFEVFEAPIFSDELQLKYPAIRSYVGVGVTNPSTYFRFGYSPQGFHGMFLKAGSTEYIDTYGINTQDTYMVYRKIDVEQADPFEFTCLLEDVKNNIQNEPPVDLKVGDCQLRTYRLALACTGEYSDFHGGTLELVLAEMAVAMTRVNGVYEKDNAITMVMVDNESIIFFDGNTDPYTNDNGGTMLGQNQNTLDEIIGEENYDIGHVFSTGGGGVAQLNSPCGNGKARGVTGLGNPINDPFYVDYVCHEMGHQFGANHTQNNSCNRSGNTAVEVGSGNTIMGYAGICSPNSKNNSDDHFHAISLAEIKNFVMNGNGATCGELDPIENTPPIVQSSGVSYVIPVLTPFKLEVSASDAEDDILTYNWEQMDVEVADMPPTPLNSEGPAFISNTALDVPYRYMPALTYVVNNQDFEWEVLPAVSREFNFICTVRDNNPMGGCTGEDEIQVLTDDAAGPFLVQSPNTNVSWSAGETETVTWDVANTDSAPINCANVDIKISLDGGFTYPITLANNIPNNGSYDVQVPDAFTDAARVMVFCSDNIFYDISDENFSIVSPFTTVVDQAEQTICPGDSATFTIDVQGVGEFMEEVNISIVSSPAEFTTELINPTGIPPFSAIVKVSGTESTPAGTYEIVLQMMSEFVTVNKTLLVNVNNSTVSEVVGFDPVNYAVGVSKEAIQLSWDAQANVINYTVQVSTNPSFSNFLFNDDINGNSLSLSNLDELTIYYWRVKANSVCLETTFEDYQSFQTSGIVCFTYSGLDTPVLIENDVENPFTSITFIDEIKNFSFAKVSMQIDHTWVGDLSAELEGPAGQTYALFDRPGVPDSNFGCDRDDLDLSFYNDAEKTADDLESLCEGSSPALVGNFQSIDLIDITEADMVGEWKLNISDDYPDDDEGIIHNWSLEFCDVLMNDDPSLVNNNLLVYKALDAYFSELNLNLGALNPGESRYTLLSTPTSGSLYLYDPINMMEMELLVGDQFTQESINTGLIRYEHNGDDAIADGFFFDAVDSQSRWAPNQQFLITIQQSGLAGKLKIESGISCFENNDGIIGFTIFGGTEPIEYSLDGENYTMDPLFTNLGPGQYTGYIKDADGNEFTTSPIVLNQPALLTASSSVTNNVISIFPVGGTVPYSYSIDGINFQVTNEFVVNENGVYTITIKDNNGCIITIDETIDISAVVITFDFIKSVVCFGASDGEFYVNAIGGITPYMYRLDNEPFGTDNYFTNVSSGIHNVEVMDAVGQIISIEVTIVELDPLTFTINAVEDEIEIIASGGMPPYQYSIDNGMNFQSSAIFMDLEAGTYNVTVLDAFACDTDTLEYLLIIESIGKDKWGQMELYPNPTNDMIYLDCNACNELPESIEIFNDLGQKVDEYEWNKLSKIELNVQSLSAGHYIIVVKGADKLARYKVLKF